MNDKSDTENEITGRIKMINPKTDKTIPEINKRNILSKIILLLVLSQNSTD